MFAGNKPQFTLFKPRFLGINITNNVSWSSHFSTLKKNDIETTVFLKESCAKFLLTFTEEQ